MTTQESLCDDCPPVGYPTDKTRCLPCPRRTTQEKAAGRLVVERHDQEDGSITYEIWDHDPSNYRRLCSLNEHYESLQYSDDGKRPKHTAKSDAARIALCWNAHDALVDALRPFAAMSLYGGPIQVGPNDIRRAVAALKLAGASNANG